MRWNRWSVRVRFARAADIAGPDGRDVSNAGVRRTVAMALAMAVFSSSLLVTSATRAGASTVTLDLSTPTATLGSWRSYSVTSTQGSTIPVFAVSAGLLTVDTAIEYIDGVEVNRQAPIAGQTISFNVEDSNGYWSFLCSAVTDNAGVAACATQEPYVTDSQGKPVYPIYSAWSAVYAGSHGAPFLKPSADYGRIPGTPVPAPTPPGNGGITIVPVRYQNGCPAPDPNQPTTLTFLITDGGNCQLAVMEKYATMAVFSLAPVAANILEFVNAAIGIADLAESAVIVETFNYSKTLAGSVQSILEINQGGYLTLSTKLLYAYFIGSGGAIVDYGVLKTIAPLNIPAGGTFSVGLGTTIDNSTSITNDGTLSDATAAGKGAGTINNTGTIINNGTIPNFGQGGSGLLITGNNFTLNFDAGASPASAPSALHVFAPSVIASQQVLPRPQPPSGDAFIGWFPAPTGGTVLTNSTDLSVLLPPGPSSMTLYARYAPVGALATATHTGPLTSAYSSVPHAVTLSAQAASEAGAVTEGTVTFTVTDGSSHLVGTATSTPVAGGMASVVYPLPAGLAAGNYTVQATYDDSAGALGFEASDGTQTLSITPAATTTVGSPTSVTYSGEAKDVPESAQVTSPAGVVNEGAVTFTLDGGLQQAVTATASVANGAASTVLHIPGGLPHGSYSIVGAYNDPAGSFSLSSDLVGGLIPQTLNVPGSPPVAEIVGNTWNVPFPYSPATSTIGAWNLDPASTGCGFANAIVTFTSVGTCILDASVPASGGYAAAGVAYSIPVGPAPNWFTTTALPLSATVGGSLPISATAKSGDAAGISIDPSSASVCTIAANVVTFNALGPCVVDFTTPSTPNYTGVSYRSPAIPVVPRQQSIAFSAPPSNPAVGDAYKISAVAPSGTAVTLAVDPPSAGVCSLSDWIITFTGIGNCKVDGSVPASGNYAQASSSQTLTVGPEAQSIGFSAPPISPVVGGTYPVSATSGSGAAVALSIDASSTGICSLSGGIVTFTGVGNCKIDGSVPASGNYAQASSSQTLTVGPAPTPMVTGVTPNAGPQTGGTLITITGSGFIPGDQVVISQRSGTGTGGIPATHVTVVSSTMITAVTGGGAKRGVWNVLVIGPTNLVSAAGRRTAFTYRGPVPPTVTAISPNSGPIAGGTTITITGTGFVLGDLVTIGRGSSAAPATQVRVVSPTEIIAVAGRTSKPGRFNLFVIDPSDAMSSAAAAADRFTYRR